MENRFDKINEKISNLTAEEFSILHRSYNNYMIYDAVSWFEYYCAKLDLLPMDVIYWFEYQK